MNRDTLPIIFTALSLVFIVGFYLSQILESTLLFSLSPFASTLSAIVAFISSVINLVKRRKIALNIISLFFSFILFAVSVIITLFSQFFSGMVG